MSPKLLGLQIIAAFSLLLQVTVADTSDGIYPDVTNCFKGYERGNTGEATRINKFLLDHCKKSNPDEGLVCWKYCMLQQQDIIDRWKQQNDDVYNYAVHPPSATGNAVSLLGISISGNPSEYTRLFELVSKCRDSSFQVPAEEDVKCKDLAPKHYENLEKLINCFEDAFVSPYIYS